MVNPLGVYDAGTALWLEGKGRAAAQEKGGEEEGKEEDVAAARIMARMEEFNRRVRENPKDTQGWLEFIHFQVRC